MCPNMEQQIWIIWWIIFCVWDSDIFEYVILKYETLTDNLPLRIYAIKKEYVIRFKVKRGNHLELLTSDETTTLHGITKI